MSDKKGKPGDDILKSRYNRAAEDWRHFNTLLWGSECTIATTIFLRLLKHKWIYLDTLLISTKEFLDASIQIKHVKNLPPMSFGVSDKEIAATIERMDGGRIPDFGARVCMCYLCDIGTH